MLNNIEAVFFDLDGTLMDSLGVWVDLDNRFVEDYHLVLPDDFYPRMEGMSFEETADYYLTVFPEIPRTREELMADWCRDVSDFYENRVEIKRGVKPFLEILKKKGIRMGITSSNHRSLIEKTLSGHGIRSYFSVIVTSGEAGKGKPAPDVYLKAAEALGVSPEKALVFEDVPKGILAGKNAGMRVCAVEDRFSASQREEKKALADYYIEDFSELL